MKKTNLVLVTLLTSMLGVVVAGEPKPDATIHGDKHITGKQDFSANVDVKSRFSNNGEMQFNLGKARTPNLGVAVSAYAMTTADWAKPILVGVKPRASGQIFDVTTFSEEGYAILKTTGMVGGILKEMEFHFFL